MVISRKVKWMTFALSIVVGSFFIFMLQPQHYKPSYYSVHEWKGLDEQKIVNILGEPKYVEEFTFDRSTKPHEVDPDLSYLLKNTNFIKVRTMQWKKKDEKTQVWLIKEDNVWIVVDSLVWRDGIQF